jgi:hypothetical protein
MRLILALGVACLGCTTNNSLANQSDGGDTDGGSVEDLAMSLPDLTPSTLPDLAGMNQSMPDLIGTDFGGVSCGSATCGMAQVCCVTRNGGGGGVTATCVAAGTCADGGITAMCDGPEDCPAGMANCCATLMGMNMTPSGGGASCTATCDGTLTGGGGGPGGGGFTVQTKLCHTSADCAGYTGSFMNNSSDWDACCYNNNAPNGGRFCANPGFAAFGGYTCP